MARFTDYVVNLFVKGNADGEFEKLRKKAEKLEEKLRKLKERSGGLKDNFEKLGKGVGKVTLGVTAAAAAFGKLATAYGEQVKVDKQLQMSLRATGLAASDVTQKFDEATAAFAKNQKETIFGDEEQSQALSQLMRVTGDYDTALGLLTDTLDLATASGESLSGAAKRIGEAYAGDIGPLKEVGVLTAEQIKNFNEIDDASRRGAQALDIFREKLGGARLEVGEIAQTSAQLKNDLGDVEQAAGEFALSLANLTVKQLGFADSTKEGKSALSEFAGEISNASKNFVTYWENTTAAEKATDVFVKGVQFGAIDERLAQIAERSAARVEQLKEASRAVEELRENLRRPILMGGERLQVGPEIKPLRDEAYFEQLEKEQEAERKKERDAAKKRADDRKAELDDLLNYEKTLEKRAFFDSIAQDQEAEQKEREAFARREEIARLNLESLNAGNEARRIEIEQQIELLQLANQELTATEKQVEVELIQRRTREKLQAEDRKQKQVALKGMQQLERAQQESNNVQLAAVSGAIQVADSLIENERAIAAVKAAFEAAQAIAAGAAGNVPAAIGHAAASVQFAAVAGGAGGGGGAAPSVAASTGGNLAPQAEQQARETGKIFAEELAAAQEANRAPIQVTIDMGSSVNLESSAKTARRISDAIQTANLDQLRRN